MKKKIILTLMVVLCALSISGCIIWHDPVIPIVTTEVGEPLIFQLGILEGITWHSKSIAWGWYKVGEGTRWLFGCRDSCTFHDEGEGIYFIGVRDKSYLQNCVYIWCSPGRIDLTDYRVWVVNVVEDIASYEEINAPDILIEAEEWVESLADEPDTWNKDEYIESE